MQDPEVTTEFSDLLRAERERAGISQETLAALAGLDRSAVGQLERAVTSPRLTSVIRLAGALDLDPCALLPAVRWKPPSGSEGSFVKS